MPTLADIMSWWGDRQAAKKIDLEPPADPREGKKKRYEGLPGEIKAAAEKLRDASLDENRYRATHASHEKIFNGQYQISVNAMKSDFADSEIQRRIRRTTAAKQRFCALLDEYTRLKKELGHATY